MTFANMGEEPLTLKEPVSFELEITRRDDSGETVLWRGKLPALEGTLAPLDYKDFQWEWNGLDSDGNPLPAGKYLLGIKLPITIPYQVNGKGEPLTEEATHSIRTHFPLTLDWPQ